MVLKTHGQRAAITGEKIHSSPKVEREVETPGGRYRNVVVEKKHACVDVGEWLNLVMTAHIELKTERRDSERIPRARLLGKHCVHLAVVVLLRRLMQNRYRHYFAHPAQRRVFAVENHDRVLAVEREEPAVVGDADGDRRSRRVSAPETEFLGELRLILRLGNGDGFCGIIRGRAGLRIGDCAEE